MNSGDLQARVNPHSSKQQIDLTDAKVTSANDKTPIDPSKTSFKDLIMGANADQQRARAAQKNGNEMSAVKSDAEFAAMMANKANAAATRKPGGNQLDKDAFLKLFITQVQNQDPLKPDDSSQMAAQLAQFDGLEQMMNVNKNLEKMAKESETQRSIGLINFVGKELKLDGGKLAWHGGKVTDSTFSLDKDTAKTTLEVRDAAGVVVSTQDLGQLNGGDHKLEWNGKSKDGKNVAEGVYTFAVLAKDIQGNTVDARISSNVKVTGVDLKDAGGAFYTDVGKVGIAEVASVGDKGFASRARAADAVKGVGGSGAEESVPVEQIDAAMRAATQLMQEHGNEPAAVAEAQRLMLAAQQAQQLNAEIAQRAKAPEGGVAPVSEIAVPGSQQANSAEKSGQNAAGASNPAAPAKPPVTTATEAPEPTPISAVPPPSSEIGGGGVNARANTASKPALSFNGGIEIPAPKT